VHSRGAAFLRVPPSVASVYRPPALRLHPHAPPPEFPEQRALPNRCDATRLAARALGGRGSGVCPSNSFLENSSGAAALRNSR